MLKAILNGGKHRRTDGEPVVIVNCGKGVDGAPIAGKETAEEAAVRLGVLMRKTDKETDTGKEQA